MAKGRERSTGRANLPLDRGVIFPSVGDLASESGISPAILLYAHIDSIYISPDEAVCVQGWVNDQSDRFASIAIGGQGADVDSSDGHVIRYARTDVLAAFGFTLTPETKFGFLAFFPKSIDLKISSQVVTVLVRSKGNTVHRFSKEAENVSHDVFLEQLLLPFEVEIGRGDVASPVDIEVPEPFLSYLIDIGKVSSEYSKRKSKLISIAHSNIAPEITAIVTVGNVVDFQFVQQALFQQTEYMSRMEWIYVVDNPTLERSVIRNAERAHALYGVSVSVLAFETSTNDNVARNLAARHAEAPTLAFLTTSEIPSSLSVGAAREEKRNYSHEAGDEKSFSMNSLRMAASALSPDAIEGHQSENRLIVDHATFLHIGGLDERFLSEIGGNLDFFERKKRLGSKCFEKNHSFCNLEYFVTTPSTNSAVERRRCLYDRLLMKAVWSSNNAEPVWVERGIR